LRKDAPEFAPGDEQLFTIEELLEHHTPAIQKVKGIARQTVFVIGIEWCADHNTGESPSARQATPL